MVPTNHLGAGLGSRHLECPDRVRRRHVDDSATNEPYCCDMEDCRRTVRHSGDYDAAGFHGIPVLSSTRKWLPELTGRVKAPLCSFNRN